MKTNWGEFNFISVDSIKLNEDMIEITNLSCVPRETILIKNASGVFAGVPSTGNFYVVFPYIQTTISDAIQEIPEIKNMIMEMLQNIEDSQKDEEEEDKDEEDSRYIAERYWWSV